MGTKAMDSPGNVHAAERLAPGYRISLSARLDRQGIRIPRAPSDDLTNLFLDVDERLFHDQESVGQRSLERKEQYEH